MTVGPLSVVFEIRSHGMARPSDHQVSNGDWQQAIAVFALYLSILLDDCISPSLTKLKTMTLQKNTFQLTYFKSSHWRSDRNPVTSLLSRVTLYLRFQSNSIRNVNHDMTTN
jgi:hypothetical protein